MTPATTQYGWHLLAATRKLGYRDGRRVFTGRTYKAKGRGALFPQLCSPGMHACKPTSNYDMRWSTMGTLQRPREGYLCWVRVDGVAEENKHKFVGKSRTVLWSRKLPKSMRACSHADMVAWAEKHGAPPEAILASRRTV